MSIFVLPNELLEQIIWQISSDDIENFSATSRLLRTLAAPYLKEHFHLKSQYGYSINYPTKRPFHPADLLSAIVENPKIAFYVKALSLTFRPALSPTRSNPSWERTQALITRHNGFLDQLHEIPWIPDREISMWHNRISSGSIDALFALLLCYLHNLREMRIQRPILIPMTSVTIGRLKASIVESITCDTSSFAEFLLTPPEPVNTEDYPYPPGLSRLERIIIDPAVSAVEAHPRQRFGDFARFASFSALPSLHSLNGISLVSRRYNLDQTFTGFSGLRSIRLIDCHVAPEALRSLFAGIKSLESFHYTPATAPQAKLFYLTPVIEDLKRYAAHSLKHLYLRHNRIETRPDAWKYRAFELLKKVDLDWRCTVYYEAPSRPPSSSSSAAEPLPVNMSDSSYAGFNPGPSSTALLSSSASASNPSTSLTGAPPPKFHHPPLIDSLPRSTESLKIVDTDGEAKLEIVRWLFFKLVKQRTARLPNLKIIIFVTPRRDCWLHAKDICTRAGLKFPSYGVERERKIRELNFLYE